MTSLSFLAGRTVLMKTLEKTAINESINDKICYCTFDGSTTATLPGPIKRHNLDAIEHPPAPPPSTTTGKCLISSARDSVLAARENSISTDSLLNIRLDMCVAIFYLIICLSLNILEYFSRCFLCKQK